MAPRRLAPWGDRSGDVPNDGVGVLPDGKEVELVDLAAAHLKRPLQCSPLAGPNLAPTLLTLAAVRAADVVLTTVVNGLAAAVRPAKLLAAPVSLQNVATLVAALQFNPVESGVTKSAAPSLRATVIDVAELGLVLELEFNRPRVVGFAHALRTSPGAAYLATYGEGAEKSASCKLLSSSRNLLNHYIIPLIRYVVHP